MIHSRSEWTDFQPPDLAWLGKRYVVVHWTAGPYAADFYNVGAAELMRRMESYHMNAKGGWAIFYNFVVDPDGEVWEGRGFGMRGGAQGVYESDQQDLSVSCILGPGETPTPKMLAGLNQLRLMASAAGWDDGTRGHKDFKPKSCPGPDLYEWVNAPKEEPSMLTPEQEAFVVELHQRITEGGGNARSLAYVLESYRSLAGRVGVSGANPALVANGIALLRDLNELAVAVDQVTEARSEAAAAKALAQGVAETLEKVKAAL